MCQVSAKSTNSSHPQTPPQNSCLNKTTLTKATLVVIALLFCAAALLVGIGGKTLLPHIFTTSKIQFLTCGVSATICLASIAILSVIQYRKISHLALNN